MAMIPFAEWRPDMPSLSQWALEATNVVPAEESYRPFHDLVPFSDALTSRAQGATWFRGTDQSVKMFAGDADKLYLLDGTVWNDVTRLGASQNITDITQDDPGVIEIVGHGYSDGDRLALASIGGMTELNSSRVTVTVIDPDTFSIGVDTTGFSAYTSGGTATLIVPYAPGGDGAWRFTQFGSLALAVNGVDAPQKFDLSAGAAWEALGGSPPVATYIATVRNFIFVGRIGATPQRIAWCGLNNAEAWGSDPSTQADFQDLPDGGNVTGLVGGEAGLIFSETAIRRATYEGPPVIFRLDKIANDLGCSIPSSLAGLLDRAFFLHKSGFYMVVGAQQVVPIGRGKIDRTFWAEFDETNHFRGSAAIDPVRGLYAYAYPANGGNGTPNRILVYNWTRERWARIQVNTELIFGGVSQQSVDLEGLDAFGDLDSLPYSLDSSYWSGALSLLLFGFDTGNRSGSFSGLTLPATLETGEFNPGKGKRSVISELRPLIDGAADMTVQLGARETQQQSVAYGPAVSLTPAGMAPVYGSGRYFRVKVQVPAGDARWANAQGVDDIDAQPDGEQ